MRRPWLVVPLGLLLAGAAAPAPLPPPAFAPLPGWLGLATGPARSPKLWFTPYHPSGEVVLFTERDFPAPRGTKLAAISPAGVSEVTYVGDGMVPYGCEGTPTRMSAFDLPQKLPEGPVWLLPAGGRGAAVPVEAGPVVPGKAPSRTFRAGPLTLVATRTSERAGTLSIEEGGKRVAALPFEKHLMEGADESPLDLASADAIGLPVPRWAFRLGDGADAPLAVVLSVRGWEGVTFRVVAKTPGAPARLLEESLGLYHCAF